MVLKRFHSDLTLCTQFWLDSKLFELRLDIDLNLIGLSLNSVSTSPGLGLDKGGLDYSSADKPQNCRVILDTLCCESASVPLLKVQNKKKTLPSSFVTNHSKQRIIAIMTIIRGDRKNLGDAYVPEVVIRKQDRSSYRVKLQPAVHLV